MRAPVGSPGAPARGAVPGGRPPPRVIGARRRIDPSAVDNVSQPSKHLLCIPMPSKPTTTSDSAPPRRDDNRRHELIRAAARLFREKGFEGTTVRDIAGAVEMRSGSPFYHFANKHELLLAVMEEGLRVGLQRVEATLAEAHALTASERFRRLVRAQYSVLHDEGADFIPVMLYDWRSLPADYKRRIIALKDRYDALWQQAIDDLHAEGRLRADPKLARLLILGAINFSSTWYQPQGRSAGHADLDTLAEQTVRLVLADR
jgi:AcrR family transcriptional regulator